MIRTARWARAAGWLVTALAGTLACRAALGTVLDLPPPRPPAPGSAPPRDTPASPARLAAAFPVLDADTARPAIERVRAIDSVVTLLPRDHAGNIDWVAADRSGVIRPRDHLPGTAASSRPTDFRFAFDFNYPGPDTLFDASFAHSTHTEWVACQQCHPRIFPYRNTRVTMADVLQGKFCGECHGKVAFPVVTGCERCHRRLALPAHRAKPEVLGRVVLQRVADDSGNARGVDAAVLPRATFPHVVHRLRFRCKVCHLEIFEPKQGANRVTMRAILAGEACGKCHNGTVAFAPDIGNCSTCHVDSTPAAARQ